MWLCTQDVGRNVCHGSDSVDNAKKEIDLWFKKDEVVSWKQAAFSWIYVCAASLKLNRRTELTHDTGEGLDHC